MEFMNMNIENEDPTNKRPRSPSSEGSTGTLVDDDKDMNTERDEIDMQILLEKSLANMANTIDTVDTGVKSTSKEAGEEEKEKEEAGEKEEEEAGKKEEYVRTETLLTEFNEVKKENIESIFKRSKPILDYLQSCGEQYFNDIKQLGSEVGETYQKAKKTYNNVEKYYESLREKGLVAASNAYDMYVKLNMEDTAKTALGLDDNTITREHEKMAFIALQELIYETTGTILDDTQDQKNIKKLIEDSLKNEENNEQVEEKKQQLKTHVELAAKTLFFFKHGKSVVDSLSIVKSSGTGYFVPRDNIDLLTKDRNTQLTKNVNQLLNGDEYLPFLTALAQDFVGNPNNPDRNDSKYYGSTNVESFFIGRFDLIQHDFDFAIGKLEERLDYYKKYKVSSGNSIPLYRSDLNTIKVGFEKSVNEDENEFADHFEKAFKKFEYSGSEEDIGALSNTIYNKIDEVKKHVNEKVEEIKGIIERIFDYVEKKKRESMTIKAQRTISSTSRPTTDSVSGGSKKGIKGKKTFSKKKTMGKFKKKGKRGKTEKRKKNTIKRRPYMNKKKLSIKK